MIDSPTELQSWARHRWWRVIGMLMLLQVGLIFWLSGRKVAAPLRAVTEPAIHLFPNQIADLPGLTDPTWFVLASKHGFSAPAWLKLPSVEYQLAEVPEPPRPLKRPEQFGNTLNEFVRNNLSQPLEVAAKPEPLMDTVDFDSVPELAARQSTVFVEGELRDRPLLTVFKLKSWPSPEILSNSVVQIAVDEQGRVFSPVLLSGCGSKEADASASALAAAARFQPWRRGGAGERGESVGKLAWGTLVFHWNTSPMTVTNVAAAGQ